MCGSVQIYHILLYIIMDNVYNNIQAIAPTDDANLSSTNPTDEKDGSV